MDLSAHPSAIAEAARHRLPGKLNPIDPATVERAVTLVKEKPPSPWLPLAFAVAGTSLPIIDLSINASSAEMKFRQYAYLVVTVGIAIGSWRAPHTWWKLHKARQTAQSLIDIYLRCMHAALGPEQAPIAESDWRRQQGLED